MTSNNEDEMTPLSKMKLYSGEENKDHKPMNVHPFVIEEPILLVLDSSDSVL